MKATRERERQAVAAILALGAVLRLLWLGRVSLWTDEAVTLAIGREPLERIPELVKGLETTPPLHFLLMRLWLPFWSDALIGLRSFSVVCGIAALFVYRSICRRLFPAQVPLALFAGAASSLWIHAAQTGRCYGLFLLLACVQVELALRLREAWSSRRAALYAACAGLGMFTHYYFHLLLLSLAFSLALEASFRQKNLGRWLALNAAAAALFLPWVPQLIAQRKLALTVWFQNTPLSAGLLAGIFGSHLFDAGYLGLAMPGSAPFLGAAALSALAASLWFLRKKMSGEEGAAVRLCLFNLGFPLAAACAVELINGRPVFQARYLLFLGIFFYPVLAFAAERLPFPRAFRMVLAGSILCGTAGYFTSNLVVDPKLGALCDFIRRASPPEVPVVHWGALDYAELRYYYLPDRKHYLLDLEPGDTRYARLPGYAGLIEREELLKLSGVVVFDPRRRAFDRRVGTATGKQLYALTAKP